MTARVGSDVVAKVLLRSCYRIENGWLEESHSADNIGPVHESKENFFAKEISPTSYLQKVNSR